MASEPHVLAAAVALLGVHAHAFITMSTARPSALSARARGSPRRRSRHASTPSAPIKSQLFEQTSSRSCRRSSGRRAPRRRPRPRARRPRRRRARRGAEASAAAAEEGRERGVGSLLEAARAQLSPSRRARLHRRPSRRARDAIVATIAALAGASARRPSASPAGMSRSALARRPSSRARSNGTWKTHRGERRGRDLPQGAARQRATSQEIDAAAGTFTNVVDFDAPVRGFRVVVAGAALSDTEVQLAFHRRAAARGARGCRCSGASSGARWPRRGAARAGACSAAARRTNASRGDAFELLFLVADAAAAHLRWAGFVQRRRDGRASSEDVGWIEAIPPEQARRGRLRTRGRTRGGSPPHGARPPRAPTGAAEALGSLARRGRRSRTARARGLTSSLFADVCASCIVYSSRSTDRLGRARLVSRRCAPAGLAIASRAPCPCAATPAAAGVGGGGPRRRRRARAVHLCSTVPSMMTARRPPRPSRPCGARGSRRPAPRATRPRSCSAGRCA